MKLKYEFATENVGGQTVAVAIGAGSEEFNGMIKLNATGALVFEMLGGGASREQVLEAMAKRFDASKMQLEADLDVFLATLRSNGLLVG